jgi:hypothetical protein
VRPAARPSVRACLRAAAGSLVALLIGGAGLFAISSSSTSVSLVRMALAAVVLALLSSLAGILLLRRDEWSPVGRGACGALVPVLVGLGTGLFVGPADGPAAAVLAGTPWLVGGLLGAVLNPFVADLAWVGPRRKRERRPRALP